MSSGPEVRVEHRDGVWWIVLDRPESRNGMTLPVVERLTDALGEAAVDDAVRVVVLGGANGAFCSGLDLKSMIGVPVDPERGLALFHGLVRARYAIYKPTIAAIDGAAAGFGADLAFGCDLRFASRRARLGERFVRIGLMPDGGGSFHLPRLVGTARAFELMYEGRMVEVDEAFAIGLINRVLPDEGFADAVHAYAATLAKGPPLAYAHVKRAIQASAGDLEVALAAERAGQLDLLGSADFAEGLEAFLAKREPRFTGR